MAATSDAAVRDAMAAYSAVQTTAASTLDATDLRLMSAISEASVALDALRDLFPAALFEPLVERNLELVELIEGAVLTLLPTAPALPADTDTPSQPEDTKPPSSFQLVQSKAEEMNASLEKLLIPKLVFTEPSGDDLPAPVPELTI
ncbi:hypothetical protein HDZ31DRAFT_62940 [Schizophyllum fasciatum]